MQRNSWENLTGLFIAGTRTMNGETIISGWDRNGKSITLKVSGSIDKIEKVEKKSPQGNSWKYPGKSPAKEVRKNEIVRTDQRRC